MNSIYFPRYLDLLSERLAEEERAVFRTALPQMPDVSITEAELRGAEAFVWAAATTHD